MSHDASEPKLCPKCQAPLPADAPQGLCPRCLLAAASVPTEAGQPAGRPALPSIGEIAVAFPQLEILEFIGQGGMGFVFKARQPKLDRLVALKILPQSLAADPTFAERFNREAKLLARLSHPGIVTVHDFGVAVAAGILPAVEPGVPPGGKGVDISGTLPNYEAIASSSAHLGGKMPPSTSGQRPDATRFYYLLMEFVDGVNLRQAMQAGRFTPAQALAIVPKICEALQFAHNEGILHRDIKPENILLDAKGRVKIADFGIAKLMEGRAGSPLPAAESNDTSGAHGVTRPTQTNLTEAGKTLGSPNYMAPEQLEHPGEVDHRADIYSLGVVFYEMLTGELPLGRFAPPSQKSAADPRVDEVVLRALEKERERRQHSAGEVRTQVETIVSDPKKAEGVPRHFFPPETPLPNTSFDDTARKANRWWLVFSFPGIFLLFYLFKGGRLVDFLGSDSSVLSLVLMGAFALLTLLSHVRKQRGRIVLVGVSNGKRVINWNGVIQTWAVIYGAAFVTLYLAFGRWVPLHNLLASLTGGVTVITAAWVRGLLKRPIDQLPPGSSQRQEAHSEKSEIGNRKSEIAPRFSRTAIVGAGLLLLPLLACGYSLLIAIVSPGTKPWELSVLAFWGGFLKLLCIAALVATTILGWIAVSQIRRSAGKLHGLWLAVFDGLLFPLLALDGLIFVAVGLGLWVAGLGLMPFGNSS
jgi:serine/threonine protein kinase